MAAFFGIEKSNIIVYPDDIVLLAPSRKALQLLVNEALLEANKIDLKFNFLKSKSMIFYSHCKKNTEIVKNLIQINDNFIENTKSFKYLGYIITSELDNTDDMIRVRNRFYVEFNTLLRNFSFTDKQIKLFLFRQYCLQFYGSELWFGGNVSQTVFKQFNIGFHKAIKKILELSYHESNHFACEQANILMFSHMLPS